MKNYYDKKSVSRVFQPGEKVLVLLPLPVSFPLHRMEDCIDRVGSAKFVTKLDLLKGYWQVPLTPRASDISAFVTPDAFLQYTVMPFGLRNAPATFQRFMHRVLSGVSNCEAYLYDVAFSSSWTEHLNTLSIIFRRFREASLTLNLEVRIWQGHCHLPRSTGWPRTGAPTGGQSVRH